MVKISSNILLIVIIGLAVIFSGCTGSKDITPTSTSTQTSNTIQPTQTSITATPQASITVSQSEGGLKFDHRGGDSIVLSDVKIVIEQGGANAIFDRAGQSDDRFVVGDTLYIRPTGISLNGKTLTTGKISIEGSGTASGGKVTVTMIYLPNGKEIAKIDLTGGFFSSILTTPQASIVITQVGSGQVALAHRGGDSITLSDVKIIIGQGGANAIFDRAGQSDDKFVVGNALYIRPTGISLNGKTLTTGKISIEGSGTASGGKVTVTMIYLPEGKEIARMEITSGGFFN